MDEIRPKYCTKCGLPWPGTRDFFNRNAGGRNGLLAQCKVCTRKYARANSAMFHSRRMSECDARAQQMGEVRLHA